ncbi:hypothetical protein [Nocardioides currus]|uniref:Uncharacterized protein n=1 Tax=Nocardioides currus TaxID=2133958 RepID=A0A2R7YUM9_9ACTN|nr:hypothetical protein [Nocardioides currus]PUA80120.1 hypothetical protein C7S10_16395 [Nocardioides currus]
MSHPLHPETHAARTATRERCQDFLSDRLVEELAQLWERDARPGAGERPGLAAQVAVLDDLVTTLDRGELPAPADLRILLFAYGRHPAYDPGWALLANA